MKSLGCVLHWVALSFLVALACRTHAEDLPRQPSIPYLATRNDFVRDMLWMAEVGKGDVVYDLGSGDGRIPIAAVRDFGADRAVGIEIENDLILESRKKALEAGVSDRVEFIEGDLFDSDFSNATVLTLFLGHTPNLKLRPKVFRMLKPGTRVLSHQFGMGEWATDKDLTVRTAVLGMWGETWNPFEENFRVPDYSANESHFGTTDKILMWVLPARAAGVWLGKFETPYGPHDLELILHQRLSVITGNYSVKGSDEQTGELHTDYWGSHLRFACRREGSNSLQPNLRFDGHVDVDTLRGNLSVPDGKGFRESAWEARRVPSDYTGAWEWVLGESSKQFRLEIDRGRKVTPSLCGRGHGLMRFRISTISAAGSTSPVSSEVRRRGISKYQRIPVG